MESIYHVRKQNSSCDPCRRSKRRCAFPPDVEPGPPSVCRNCAHLGHKCTFDFVISRLGQRGKRSKQPAAVPEHRRQFIAPVPAKDTSPDVSPSSPETLDTLTPNHVAAQHALWSGVPYTGFLGVDMFMGNLVSELANLNGEVESYQPASPAKYDRPTGIYTSNWQSTGDHDNPGPSMGPRRTPSAPGLWSGSPIHLLNSSVETQLINQSLGDIYSSMMSGIATRYLDYACNLFAGSYKYSFDDDARSQHAGLGHSGTVSVPKMFTPSWRKQTSDGAGFHGSILSPEMLEGQINKVTMIGVARFLDNFGPLYGNIIDQSARSLNDRTLTAVLQAFSLQFSPSNQTDGPKSPFKKAPDFDAQGSDSDPSIESRSTNSSNVFTAAWFNAHSHLVASKNSRSFVKLYSTFLFRMTTIPPEAQSMNRPEEAPLELLNVALQQMEELQDLIETYTEHLGPKSIYRFLLHSTLGIIRWYGYLRDTIESVLYDRPCFLKDAPPRSQGSLLGDCVSPEWQEPAAFDQEVHRVSQSAAGDLFHIYRGMIRLRQILIAENPSSHLDDIRNTVNSALRTTEEFVITYGSWLEHCIISFYLLSEKAKLSSAFLILFWNLGKFTLVEQLHRAADVLPVAERSSILDTAHTLQKDSVTSFLITAQRIVDVSAMGEFKLINSVQAKLNLISHHANTSLVVLALVKGIEHTIDLNINVPNGPGDEVGSGFDPNWVASIKPLLSCLLTLDSTVSGAYTARPALQTLMQQYGDILMDCWSHDDHVNLC